jgi:HEPN domain-containing protein
VINAYVPCAPIHALRKRLAENPSGFSGRTTAYSRGGMGTIAAWRQLVLSFTPLSGGELKPRALRVVVYWLKKAEEDFGLARHLLDEGSEYLHAIAFHAQQAAEKYLKALLVFHQQEFPKTHDIAELLDILAKVDKHTAAKLASVDELNPFAIEARYPGDLPEIDLQAAKEAVSLAEVTKINVLQALKQLNI